MWTFEELVRSRTHRKLSDCPRFSNKVLPEDIFFVGLEGEEGIGTYSYEDMDRIVITTRGIRTKFGEETQFVPYSEMVASQVVGDWSIPNAKTTADKIQITMKDGNIREIWIRGGDGRFRDIWQFSHFLSHAINDYKKYSPQPEST